MHRPRKGGSTPSVYVFVGGVVLALIVAATAVAAFRSEERREVARYRAWWIEGPACPPADSATARKIARRRSVIDDVTVARENGSLVCLPIKDRGGRGSGDILACHLFAPGVVAVTTPVAAVGFDPGPGRSAAVFVRGRAATCVMRINPALFSASSERPYD